MCHCFRTLAEMRVETYHTTHKSNGNALLLKYRKASNNASSWCPSVLMLMYYTYSYMLHRASVPHAGIISSSPSAALGTSKCQLLARRKLHSTPSTQGVCWLGAGGDPWSWTCDVFTNNSCRSSAAAAAASGELPPAPDTRHWSLDTGRRQHVSELSRAALRGLMMEQERESVNATLFSPRKRALGRWGCWSLLIVVRYPYSMTAYYVSIWKVL